MASTTCDADNVDPFVVMVAERITTLERVNAHLTRANTKKDQEIYVLVVALAKHEGGDVRTTALTRLGREITPPWGGE